MRKCDKYLIKDALDPRLSAMPLKRLVRAALKPQFSSSQERLLQSSLGFGRNEKPRAFMELLTDVGELGRGIVQGGVRSGLRGFVPGVRA